MSLIGPPAGLKYHGAVRLSDGALHLIQDASQPLYSAVYDPRSHAILHGGEFVREGGEFRLGTRRLDLQQYDRADFIGAFSELSDGWAVLPAGEETQRQTIAALLPAVTPLGRGGASLDRRVRAGDPRLLADLPQGAWTLTERGIEDGNGGLLFARAAGTPASPGPGLFARLRGLRGGGAP